MQPTKFELMIDLRTAQTRSIDVPSSLLAIADEVIEWILPQLHESDIGP